jgi:calmodulin
MTSKKDLTPSQLRELREEFTHFDGDQNGFIDREEFRRFIHALSGEVSDEEIDIGLGIVDRNRDGKIQFDEFVRWWSKRG